MVNIMLNYNYIEISDPHGMCFDIEGKKFVLDPDLQGASPRAFLYYKYDEDVIPYPSKFISGNFLLLSSFVNIIIIIAIFDIWCIHLWWRWYNFILIHFCRNKKQLWSAKRDNFLSKVLSTSIAWEVPRENEKVDVSGASWFRQNNVVCAFSRYNNFLYLFSHSSNTF